MKQRIFPFAVALTARSPYGRNWRYFRTEAEALTFAESIVDVADTVWKHDGQAWTINKTQPTYTYGR